MIRVQQFNIDGPLLLTPKFFSDERGYFVETFNQREFCDAIQLDVKFVQDNESKSQKGVLRGLHYQNPPMAQGKLVRVISGRILDIALDLRSESATFGQHLSVELTSDDAGQLWIPEGFAHGFLSLADGTRVAYKTTQFYSPDCEAGVRWDDEALGINWPLDFEFLVSPKDQKLPKFHDLNPIFWHS